MEAYINESKSTVQLAVPIVTAQLSVILMGVSDNIMIGRMVGKEALAASGLAHSLSFLISSIAVGGLSVLSPIIAKHKAANQPKELEENYRASIRVSIWFSLLITIVALLVYLDFHILGQSLKVSDLSKPFFLIVTIAKIPLIFFVAHKQILDGLSKPKIAMYITFVGLLVNILLNYILIKIIGLNGAAYSTLGVRLSMLALIIWYFKRKPFWVKTTINFKSVKADAIKLFRLSIPGGLQLFFEIGAFSAALIMMGWISDTAMAAHQIAINIAATTYMMATGISYAGSIRVGDALGLRNLQRLRESANSAYFLVTLFMIVCMAFILVFRNQLINLYIDDQEVKAVASSLLIIAAIFQLSDGIQVVALGNLRGISDVNIPAYITFAAYWLISLPAGYILAFNYDLQSEGIWYGLLAGLSSAAILLTLRFSTLIKKSAGLNHYPADSNHSI
ncbi:hypothetical protein TK44_09385 [Jiulongibacter sediminis]|nr:hypothetical protein TK44_09385 [Jiulongibacter sediminis]